MSPFSFHPIYMNRVWGGDTIKSRFGRDVPAEANPCGESWELVDREEAQSVVKTGKFKGLTLNELWTKHREDVFGSNLPNTDRFPLLFKILDCQKDLSVQVHPPEKVASALGGEAKSELWYIADAKPGAKLYVGLKEELSREEFKIAIETGTVAEKIHEIEPKVGDSIYLESGRLHAIGAGFLIFEIQQNSDTTYRVFDWNRVGLDGNLRQLHIQESLECIDYTDISPQMNSPEGNLLQACEYFRVEKRSQEVGSQIDCENEIFSVLSIVKGTLRSSGGETFSSGDTVLIPTQSSILTVEKDSEFLITTLS